jgi:hypothetical protein
MEIELQTKNSKQVSELKKEIKELRLKLKKEAEFKEYFLKLFSMANAEFSKSDLGNYKL